MNNNFYNSIVARTNLDYLESMQRTINQLIGCIVEKILFTAIYEEDYRLCSTIIDVEINELINDIKESPQIVKYHLLCIFLNISNFSTKDKNDLFVDITSVSLKSDIDPNVVHNYLQVEFPFRYNLNNFNYINVKISHENKELINNLFDRIIQIGFCNNKEYHLDNKKNRLYTFIKPDEILLIGNDAVRNITFKDLISKKIDSNDSDLDISMVLNPLIECLESNHDALSLNLFSIKL